MRSRVFVFVFVFGVFVFVFGVFVFVFGVFYQNHFGFPSSSPFSPRWGVVLLSGGTGYANHLSYLFPETLPLLYSREDFWPPKVLNMQNIGYANHPLFPETLPLAQLHMYRVFGPIKVLNMERLGECANHPAALSSLKLYPCSTLGKSFMHGVFWPPKSFKYANHPALSSLKLYPLLNCTCTGFFGQIKVSNMERLGESANHPSSPLFPETLPLLMLSLL